MPLDDKNEWDIGLNLNINRARDSSLPRAASACSQNARPASSSTASSERAPRRTAVATMGPPPRGSHAGTKIYSFDTLTLHAGQQPDARFGARATPIYQTTSFVFKDSDQACRAFQHGARGSRLFAHLEPDLCRARGAGGRRSKAASARSRRRAARPRCTWPSRPCWGAGSHIVASRSLYGGSHNLLHYTLPRFGIETTFVDPRSVDAFKQAIRPNTRLVFGETLGNPGLDVLDVPAGGGGGTRGWSAAARRFHVHDALPDAAIRARRRPDLSLRDEISRRPRRRDRRRAGRRRQLRLGGFGQISRAV
jgi:hypothetical protein